MRLESKQKLYYVKKGFQFCIDKKCLATNFIFSKDVAFVLRSCISTVFIMFHHISSRKISRY